MGKPVIMVVDDQSFICDLVTMMLKDKYTVEACTSGKDAIDYLTENNVDLILLDYDMPNMTGYEVLMSVRMKRHTTKIPVVFITGVTNPRLESEMMDRGATDFILKPIQLPALLAVIEKNLPKNG